MQTVIQPKEQKALGEKVETILIPINVFKIRVLKIKNCVSILRSSGIWHFWGIFEILLEILLK
jgi:hypothetical protein